MFGRCFSFFFFFFMYKYMILGLHAPSLKKKMHLVS